MRRKNDSSGADKAVSFRISMPITHVVVSRNGTLLPLCPRCQRTIFEKLSNYCSCCGQALDWSEYDRSIIILSR